MTSIVIEKLDEATPQSIASAIIIMDGTELYGFPEYERAKQQFNQNQDCKLFAKTVKPLYIGLGERHGIIFVEQ